MKKLSLFVVLSLSVSVHAQSLLGKLTAFQDTLKPEEGPRSSNNSQNKRAVTEIRPDVGGSSSSTLKCTQNDQTSLPLSYITSLILEKNGNLDIVHDPRTGNLTVNSGKMISNCSDMIEWKLKMPILKGKTAYAIEASFRRPADCAADGKSCKYKYAKMKDGDFQGWEETEFAPTLKGFEQCLVKSGVFVNDKVVPGNIYPNKLNEKFSGIDQTGQLLFLSNGPVTPITGAKFGKFEIVDGCDHYEIANQNVKELMTLADAEKKRLDAEASKLKECKAEEYGKLTEFIEKYEGYAGLLTAIRDNLMLEAVKKATKKIDVGKYTDEDLKIIADFEKYIVLPKVNKAVKTYEELLDLEGDEKKLKQAELSSLLGEIKTLNRAPYFTSAHTLKLVNNGKFDEAETLNNIVLTIESYKNLASRVDNTIITPGVAAERVNSGKRTFTEALKKEKTRYAYRTGQESGRAAEAERNSRAVRNQIQIRTQNYLEFIQEEATKLRPGGLCQRQYWRTQRCINEATENIQVAQAELQHFNKVDEERMSEYDQQAKEWGALEAQGRRHVASQNGEPLPQEPSAPAEQPRDTTRPSVRPQTQDPSVYSFNYQNPQQGQPNPQMFQQQPQMMPNQYQMPMNPYGNNNMFQQQNPYMYYRPQFLGQQNFQMPNQFGMQGGYQFNWGGGGYQQPQQQPGYFNQQYMYRRF